MRRLRGCLQLGRQLCQAGQHQGLDQPSQARQCHGHALKATLKVSESESFGSLTALCQNKTLCPGVGEGDGGKCCFSIGSHLSEASLSSRGNTLASKFALGGWLW